MAKKKGKKGALDSSNETPDSDGESAGGGVVMSRTSSRMSQLSVASSQGGGQVEGDEAALSIAEQVSSCIEDLEDKRATTRLQATQRLLKLFSNRFVTLEDVAEKDVDEMCNLSRKLIGSDGPESTDYCLVLAALWITFGSDSDRYQTASKSLSYSIKNSSAGLKCAAIAALSLISVLEKHQYMEELLSSLFSLLDADKEDTEEAVYASALLGYGLVYGNCQFRLEKEELNIVVERHLELLQSSILDVRLAAGENLALFVEDLRDREIDPMDYIHSIHEIMVIMKSLSTESTKSISKKDRATQKTGSRDFLSTIEDDIPPSIDLKFKKDTVSFGSWSQVKLLNAFRDCIGEGLHTHFYLNPLFQELFNWSGGTASERENLRLFDVTVRKQRVKDLKEQRKHKSSTRISE